MNKNPGKITLITGPMFAGKTSEILRYIRREKIAGRKTMIFKPKSDTRYADNALITHYKDVENDAIPINNSSEILTLVGNEQNNFPNLIIIDEIQFMDPDIINIIKTLADSGINIICAGLDMDFRRDPFINTAKIACISDKVIKLSAICEICGEEATLSQKFIGKIPAPFESTIIELGEKDLYKPRCKACFLKERTISKMLEKDKK